MIERRNLPVTGASGFVAGSVLAQAQDWKVRAVSRGSGRLETGFRWHRLDGLHREEWVDFFLEVRPQAVIHTAALADIDFCENHPDAAQAVNVGLTATLAELCSDHGTRLVFCSTNTVLGGERAPYQEERQWGQAL